VVRFVASNSGRAAQEKPPRKTSTRNKKEKAGAIWSHRLFEMTE
jgi:hypothetical protein